MATKGAIMGAASGFGFGVVTAGVKKLLHGDSYSFDDAVHDVGKSTFGGALFGAITGGTIEAGKQLWSRFGGKITNALGKSANKTSYGNASGTSAYQGRSGTAIKILLDLGATPNINDKEGFSPITSALGTVNKNNCAILNLMLQYGLDLMKPEGDQTLKEWIEMF